MPEINLLSKYPRAKRNLIARKQATVPGPAVVQRYSRRSQTGELARLFDTLV